MQVVILGNGFDLAGNLKTKYKDFFEYLKENNKEIYENRNEFNENDEENQININFWELYFLLKNEDIKEDKKWCEIEEEIKSFFIDKDNILSYFNLQKYKQFKSDIENENEKENRKNHLVCLMDKNIINKKLKYEIENDLQIILKELEEFENKFRTYIFNIEKEINENDSKQMKYRNNFCSIINKDIKEIFIINFNYSSIKSLKDRTSKEDTFQISRNKIQYSLKEVNVHGHCSKISIFGIDQKNIDANEDVYIFTKTFRKMSNYKKLSQLNLPLQNDVKELILYGHSLAEADYSYFQSLFDCYEIYSSSIRVKFLYSIYNKEKQEIIKMDYIKNVTKLLNTYGYSMDNKEHGKNLTHKLLLENRLSIEEVCLAGIY